MYLKKAMTGVAAVGLMAALFCGCGTNHEQMQSEHAEEHLEQIIIGSDSYPPYNYLDENGNAAGIDVELATEAFHRMGYEAVFQNIDWEMKKTLLEEGEIDCIWGCFSMEGRSAEYQWAGPYMVSNQVVAVNESSDIYQLSDLEGKTISVQSTGKPESIFLSHKDARIPQVENVYSMEERELMYISLDKGYVDAIAAHETAILQYMKDYETTYRILDENILTTGLGVAFAKQDDRGIAEELTEVLDEMRQDGTEKKILAKYLSDADKYLEVEKLEK